MQAGPGVHLSQTCPVPGMHLPLTWNCRRAGGGLREGRQSLQIGELAASGLCKGPTRASHKGLAVLMTGRH